MSDVMAPWTVEKVNIGYEVRDAGGNQIGIFSKKENADRAASAVNAVSPCNSAAPTPGERTPGEWRWIPGGRSFGWIVSACPSDQHAHGEGDEADVKHYGGHLIAESIRLEDGPLLAAAPKMLAALERGLELAADAELNSFGSLIQWVELAEAAVAEVESP